MDDKQILNLMMENTKYHMQICPEYKKAVQGTDLYEANRKFLKSKDVYTIVVKDSGDQICGYLCYKKRENGTIVISDFYVSSTVRGKGYGRKLMDKIVKKFPNKTIKLRCLKDNKLGLKFYKKYGFIITTVDTDEIGISSYELVYDSDVEIRIATNNDRLAIRNMIVDLDDHYYETIPAFKKHYTTKQRQESYDFVNKLPIYNFYVLLVKGKPVGTIAKQRNDGEWTLRNFYIDPMYRGKDYGAMLLRKVIEDIDDRYCVISAYKGDKTLVQFYERFGFKRLRTERRESGDLYWLKYTKWD